MPSQIETCVGILNESSDTNSAYFSFTTDDTGEHGVIKANKEGLRLYALELLKKSIEMENNPTLKEVLFFDDYDWLVDDAGYNLIWGVDPTQLTRAEIRDGEVQDADNKTAETNTAAKLSRGSVWLPSLIILSGGLIIVTIAALKWFH
ncbi:hypothetical protein [Flavitalea sp.]|nr:hypothetical protein [Flavitalea sp.]